MSADILIEDRYMRPSAEYPQGSWMHIIDGDVKIATGYFAKDYPDKPSPYFHGQVPFVYIDISEWSWEGKK